MSEDAAKLATLLSALTQPNTEAIRAAEAELKPILKDPRCVGALTEILAAGGPEVSLKIGNIGNFCVDSLAINQQKFQRITR